MTTTQQGGAGGWSWCDCDWMTDPRFEGGTAECGCGERHARGYRDELVHWEGKHWRVECAFAAAAARLRREGG